uniref:Uncharacterized protein n=1 Tax=Timema bartmani TaxID=61472 RepID=A0A7R9I3D8_9NEOP|nr:unnamed protein product [Timema bartmani]
MLDLLALQDHLVVLDFLVALQFGLLFQLVFLDLHLNLKQFYRLARLDNSISPTIRYIVRCTQFAIRIDIAITPIDYTIWAFIFVMELSIWSHLIAKTAVPNLGVTILKCGHLGLEIISYIKDAMDTGQCLVEINGYSTLNLGSVVTVKRSVDIEGRDIDLTLQIMKKQTLPIKLFNWRKIQQQPAKEKGEWNSRNFSQDIHQEAVFSKEN